MYKYAIDNGFAQRCAQRGITDQKQVEYLMKKASEIIKEKEELQKKAFLENINWSDPQIRNALLGGAGGGLLGAGLGGLATGSGYGALAGGLGGAGLGAGAGYMLTPERERFTMVGGDEPAIAGVRPGEAAEKLLTSEEEKPPVMQLTGREDRPKEEPGSWPMPTQETLGERQARLLKELKKAEEEAKIYEEAIEARKPKPDITPKKFKMGPEKAN